jgi:hypothetical protein
MNDRYQDTPLCLREGSRGTSSASLGAKPLVRSDGGQYTFIQVTNHDKTREVDRTIRRHAMLHFLTQQKIAGPKKAGLQPIRTRKILCRRTSTTKSAACIRPSRPLKDVFRKSKWQAESVLHLKDQGGGNYAHLSAVPKGEKVQEVNSDTVNWSDGQTYPNSDRLIYNPQSDESLVSLAGPFNIVNTLAENTSPYSPDLKPLSYESQLRFDRYLRHFALIANDACGGINRFMSDWGPLLAFDTVLLYVILGLTAAQMNCWKFGPATKDTALGRPHMSRDSFEYRDSLALKTKAAQWICKRISQGQLHSPSSIGAISFLALSEAMSSDNVALAHSHCSAAFESIRLSGGIQSIPNYVRWSAWAADLKTSTLTLSAPHFSFPEELSRSEEVRSIIADHASASLTASLPSNVTSVLSPNTISIIDSLRELHIVRPFLLDGKASTNRQFTIHLWTDHRYQIEYRLLSTIAAYHGNEFIDRTVLIAALIFYNTTAWLSFPSQTSTAQVLAQHLKNSLQIQSVNNDLMESPSLALWVLVVGASAVKGQELEQWFIQRIGKIILLLGLRTSDALRDILKSVLYVENVYGPVVDRIYLKGLEQGCR